MLKSATDPNTNVAMRAAAGTGKTWLLTSRLVSLLLRGGAARANTGHYFHP
ncbi:MAG: hypothetical protein E2O37_06660 [Proteobacteria bacterium]|nr:MAG: hypothetical protein E2O37_06660 [Pseudomonadota bacterium]